MFISMYVSPLVYVCMYVCMYTSGPIVRMYVCKLVFMREY